MGLVSQTGTSWHLPNCAVRVAVELERLGERRAGVGTYRVVAGRRGGDLGDAAHADGVMVAPGQHAPARVGEHSAVVWKRLYLQPVVRQPLGGRRLAGAAERAGGAEAHVVEQDDQDVGRALGGRSGSMGGNLVSRVFRVVGGQSDMLLCGDRQDGAGEIARRGTRRRGRRVRCLLSTARSWGPLAVLLVRHPHLPPFNHPLFTVKSNDFSVSDAQSGLP